MNQHVSGESWFVSPRFDDIKIVAVDVFNAVGATHLFPVDPLERQGGITNSIVVRNKPLEFVD